MAEELNDNNIENEVVNNEQKSMSIDDKGQAVENVVLNFKDDSFVDNIVGKKTIPFKEDKEVFKTNDATKLQEQIKQEEKDYTAQFTVKDFEEIAEFIIELIDTGVSTACKFIAKDTSDTAYMLANAKKKVLIKQLTMILVKHQMKFSITWLFVITAIIMFASPVKKAFDNRKLNVKPKSPFKEIKGDEKPEKQTWSPPTPQSEIIFLNNDNKEPEERITDVTPEPEEPVNTGLMGGGMNGEGNMIKNKSNRKRGNPGKA